MDYDALSMWFLLDEDEAVNTMVLYKKRRRKMHELLRNRASEGAFNILVKRYLIDDDTKFKAYFRLTPHLMQYVLSFIRSDITSKPCNRHGNPITPEEKLCITLR